VDFLKTMALGTVILAGWGLSGCVKKPATPVIETNAPPPLVVTNIPEPASTNPPVPSRTTDLGLLQLTNHCETRIQLAGGKSCAITPVLLDNKHVQLTVVLESKTNGITQGLNITKVVAQPGQQFEVDFGGLNLTLTPQMAGE
jgi:hypothetical protein